MKKWLTIFFVAVLLSSCAGEISDGSNELGVTTEAQSPVFVSSSTRSSESIQNSSVASEERILEGYNNGESAQIQNLDEWLGNYEFTLFAFEGSMRTAIFEISIFKEQGEYRAKVYAWGRMLGIEMNALVQGKNSEISLIFDNYVHGENVGSIWGNLEKGDVMFKLYYLEGDPEKRIYTEWIKLTPPADDAFQKKDSDIFYAPET